MLSIEIFSFSAFIIAVALLIFMDRKKIKFEGILIIRRTQKGKNFIENLADRHRKFWNYFMNLAMVAALPIMAATILLLFTNSIKIIGGEVEQGVSLVLPGPVQDVFSQPGLLIMPWWIWVVCIFVVMVSHEFSHGIASRLGKVRIKSLGWLMLLVLPGAFVEPDEKQLNKKNLKIRLRVYAAGSFANIIVGLIAFLLGFLLIFTATNTIMEADGITYNALIIGYPMEKANATGSILSINNVSIKSSQTLQEILANTPPGTAITVGTTTGNYTITTVSRPDNGTGSFIGISGPYGTYYKIKEFAQPIFPFFSGLINLIQWIFVLNIGIGMINLLPLKPLDGGLIIESILWRYLSKSATAKIIKTLSLSMMFLLLFNLFGPIFF